MSYESERRTRTERIDPELTWAGWKVVAYDSRKSLAAYENCAVKEFPTANGPADYALVQGGRVLGVVEAISKARSYAEIGEFWDEHDLSDYWDNTRKVKFDVVLEAEATYYAVSKELSEEIQSEAHKQGVPPRALWLTCGWSRKLRNGDRARRPEIISKKRVALS